MASLQQIEEALIQADSVGDTEAATTLANEIVRLNKNSSFDSLVEVTSPDDAGVENVPYIGPILRALAQPAYEGLAAAEVIASAPEFVGGALTQLTTALDIYTDKDQQRAFTEIRTREAGIIAGEIQKLIDTNQPIPKELSDTLIALDKEVNNPMPYSYASELGKEAQDAAIENYLASGVIGEGIVDSVISSSDTTPERKKELKQLYNTTLDKIEKSDYFPSKSTVLDETFLGRGLQGFGWVLQQFKDGATAMGVPEDTASSVVDLLSLAAGPKFGKGVKAVKEKTYYADAVRRVYGTTHKKQWEKTLKSKQTEIDNKVIEFSEMDLTGAPKGKVIEMTSELKDLENSLKDAQEIYNNAEFNILGGSKSFEMRDTRTYTEEDLKQFIKTDTAEILSKKGKIKDTSRERLDNTVEGFNAFKWLTESVAKFIPKAEKSAYINLAQRMQNTFGIKNGFGKEKTMGKKTIEEYNYVIDTMQNPKLMKQPYNKNQETLSKVLDKLLREDRILTRKLQREGIIDSKIEVQNAFFPRKFVKDKAGIIENFTGDPFNIKMGDLAPREMSFISSRIQYKLEGPKGTKDVYVTIAEAVNNMINPRTGKPGQPILTINHLTEAGKKVQIKPESGKDASYLNKLAATLSKQARQLNDGQGLLRSGEKVGKYVAKEITRKEYETNFTRELAKDSLAILSEAISEKRQLLREKTYERELFKSAFGERNIKIVDEATRNATSENVKMYDPLNPTQNIAKTNQEYIQNNKSDTNIKQLDTLGEVDSIVDFSNRKFSRRAGAVIEDAFRPYRPSILSKVSDAIVKNMMLNPIPHMHNELIHFYSTKGFMNTWGKDGVKNFAADGKWAQDMVFNRRNEYLDLVAGGKSSMSLNVTNATFWNKMMETSIDSFMGDAVTKGWYNKLKKSVYTGSKGYANLSNFAQYSMWTTRDVMYMQLVKQKIRMNKSQFDEEGLTQAQRVDRAAALVELHMPTYRLPQNIGPEQLLGYRITRHISKALQNPDWVIFARYKHGMVSSGLNTAKDILSITEPVLANLGAPGRAINKVLGTKDVALGRKTGKQFTDGLDSGMALSTAMYLIYPMMDALYEELFDAEEVKIRRGGILHVLETAHQVGTQEKDMQHMRQVLLTINPALLLAYELMMNETVYNGQQIYNFDDLVGKGQATDFAKDVGTKLLQTVPQVSTVINSVDEYDEFDWDKALGRQVDAKLKTTKQKQAAARRKAKNDLMNLNRAIENDNVEDYLEQYMRDNMEISDY